MRGSVVVVGEDVADAVVESMTGQGTATIRVHAGGGPANTAVALGRLGTPTRFVGRLPEGVLGSLFIERFEQSNVDLSLSVRVTEPATLAIASVDAEGIAGYQFYSSGTADWQWRSGELDGPGISEAACIHSGSLALVMEPGGAVVEEMLRGARAAATISIDPNVRRGIVDRERYRAKAVHWARLADIIRLSHDDLAELVLLSGDRTLEDVCGEWHQAGVSLVVITRGADSTIASFRGTRFEVPVRRTRVVDTIGAGDAFNAGLLHWLHRTGGLGGRLDHLDLHTVRRAVAYGSKIATISCAGPGANYPRPAEVE